MHHTLTLTKQPTCPTLKSLALPLVGIEPSSRSCTDADMLGITGIKEALQDHHRAVRDSKSGKIVHVYAYTGRAVFGQNADRLSFEVEILYADLTWNVSFLWNY